MWADVCVLLSDFMCIPRICAAYARKVLSGWSTRLHIPTKWDRGQKKKIQCSLDNRASWQAFLMVKLTLLSINGTQTFATFWKWCHSDHLYCKKVRQQNIHIWLKLSTPKHSHDFKITKPHSCACRPTMKNGFCSQHKGISTMIENEILLWQKPNASRQETLINPLDMADGSNTASFIDNNVVCCQSVSFLTMQSTWQWLPQHSKQHSHKCK